MSPTVDRHVIGDHIRRLRLKRHVSMRAFAAQTGFSPSFISQLENGQVSPSLGSRQKIADALGVTLGEFFAAAATGEEVLIFRRPDRRPSRGSRPDGPEPKAGAGAGELRPRREEREASPLALPRGVRVRREGQGHARVRGRGERARAGRRGDAPRAGPHRWENPSFTSRRLGALLLAGAGVLVALGRCGGNSSAPTVSPTPLPTIQPTPQPTATPGLPLGMTCSPTPPPLLRMQLKIHSNEGGHVILDSKPVVPNIDHYCDRVGFGDWKFCDREELRHFQGVRGRRRPGGGQRFALRDDRRPVIWPATSWRSPHRRPS